MPRLRALRPRIRSLPAEAELDLVVLRLGVAQADRVDEAQGPADLLAEREARPGSPSRASSSGWMSTVSRPRSIRPRATSRGEAPGQERGRLLADDPGRAAAQRDVRCPVAIRLAISVLGERRVEDELDARPVERPLATSVTWTSTTSPRATWTSLMRVVARTEMSGLVVPL